MGEAQLTLATIVGGVTTPTNGVEEQISDLVLDGQTGGLADDRTLAELLRLAPFSSTPARGALPYAIAGAPAIYGTVQSSLSANGSVLVFPFRAVIGSRTALGTSPLQNWRDIRTGVFVPPGVGSLSLALPLVPNASGNTRYDLVYATITVDAPTNQVVRRQKNPTSGAFSTLTVYQYLSQAVVVQVQTGTPSATPVVPALPADTGGSYNIALAAVRIPTGFGATSTVLPSDIRDQTVPPPLASSTGSATVRPATGNNDVSGTYATDPAFQWPIASAKNRPSVFIPPSMVGAESVMVLLDAVNSAHPSHANASIIDASVDWRNRLFRVDAQLVASPQQFATDPTNTSSSTIRTPYGAQAAAVASPTNDFRLANSFWADALLGANTSVLWVANNANYPSIPSPAQLGVYVNQTDGTMRAFLSSASPTVRAFLWITASAPYANFEHV